MLRQNTHGAVHRHPRLLLWMCIALHVQGALKAGAARQEVLETIGVALMMGGGPASVYAAEAYEALRQFEKASVQ